MHNLLREHLIKSKAISRIRVGTLYPTIASASPHRKDCLGVGD